MHYYIFLCDFHMFYELLCNIRVFLYNFQYIIGVEKIKVPKNNPPTPSPGPHDWVYIYIMVTLFQI